MGKKEKNVTNRKQIERCQAEIKLSIVTVNANTQHKLKELLH
jgi:hypothetical protein